jgi:hypothetical protein
MADARIYGVALSDPALAAQHDGKTRWELYYPIGRTKYVVITGAPPPSDTFFENRHPIESGMKPQTAAGMGGVLVA